MAKDLRLITSAMKINSDLERIGDQAVNVAQNGLKLLDKPPLRPLVDLPRMADLALLSSLMEQTSWWDSRERPLSARKSPRLREDVVDVAD